MNRRKKRNYRSNKRRKCTPVFLTGQVRGLEPASKVQKVSQYNWVPDKTSKKNIEVLSVLPRLVTNIGFSMAANPNAEIDVLPGSPTTVIFTVNNKLKGLMVLPIEEEEARRYLGLPNIKVFDINAHQLFEEERQEALCSPEEQLEGLWEL